MGKITLSEALKKATVENNLQNYLGLNAEGALGKMTPERLASVVGGLSEITETFTSKKSLVYIGDYKKYDSKTYEIMTFHPDGVQELYSIITIGQMSHDLSKVCRVHDFYGTLKVFNLKDTDKLYIEINSFRHVRYRLLYGTDIEHDVIQIDESQLSSKYVQVKPSIV